MAPKKTGNPPAPGADALFSPAELKDFIRFFEKVNIAEVTITSGNKSLSLNKSGRAAPVMAATPAYAHPAEPASQPAPKPASAPSPAAALAKPSNLIEITSPLVGTFYRSPDPKSPMFVNPGDTVAPGKTVCIIEAMKIFNEIKSEVSGVIKEICVGNEQPVEFGQVLFLVEPR